MTLPTPIQRGDDHASALENSLAEVRNALQRLKYGQIAITIHDGRVVQIDVTEKKRFA
ncbi:YezD family protein [Novosphingobium sp.]|jgi:hypothetical protein|uniref:YezD family protein n=1 Tax=Novosphingobium sp. TaxID=1874826 RepID=UPI0031D0286F